MGAKNLQKQGTVFHNILLDRVPKLVQKKELKMNRTAKNRKKKEGPIFHLWLKFQKES